MRRIETALLLAALAWGTLSAVASTPPSRTPIAIVVNAANRVPDPSLAELRAMFSLERQFWPDGHRIILFLPPPGSPPRQALLDRLYGMSDFELRKYWVGSLFRGAIPSIPSTLQSTDAVIAAVQESDGALSAAVAGPLPPTIRVLRIDGRGPDDAGYPLVVESTP